MLRPTCHLLKPDIVQFRGQLSAPQVCLIGRSKQLSGLSPSSSEQRTP